jgi:hypothetical protein
LTDDALPLRLRREGVFGVPGLPLMKLWPQTLQGALALEDELPNLLPNYKKKLLRIEGRYSFAESEARLCTLYLLDRYDPQACGRTEITVRTLTHVEAIGVLLAHTSWRSLLPPGELALLMRTYASLVAQVPVRVLSYPTGFEHTDAVQARIGAELEKR